MKKLFIFIMLLCSCIVFTGCGGNSNSYDNTDVKTLRISVASNVINGNQSNSARASVNLNDLKLYFNGIEFPGHSTDTDSNYIFTKIIYESQLNDIIAADTSSSTIIIESGTNQKVTEIVFAFVDFTSSSNLAIVKDKSGDIKVYNGKDEKKVIIYNGEKLADLNEVTRVSIEKIDAYNARVTFFNILNKSINIDYDSWKISALDSNLDVLEYWDSSNNNINNKVIITNDSGFTDKSYLISLTPDGIKSANSHNLNNTIVNIEYIRKDGLDVVDTGILEMAMYRPK